MLTLKALEAFTLLSFLLIIVAWNLTLFFYIAFFFFNEKSFIFKSNLSIIFNTNLFFFTFFKSSSVYISVLICLNIPPFKVINFV